LYQHNLRPLLQVTTHPNNINNNRHRKLHRKSHRKSHRKLHQLSINSASNLSLKARQSKPQRHPDQLQCHWASFVLCSAR
jgi:hypothetical protein